MKIGGRTSQNKGRNMGFTIVEALIVLAVTGLLFASAVILISGRQNKTEFSTGSRDLQSRYQRVIDDISNGYYPSNDSMKCINAAGVPTVTTPAAPVPEGTNVDCIFLGKVIQFGLAGTNPEAFRVYSVVGVRENTSNDLVTSIAEANPRLITSSGLFETITLPYGMTTGWVKTGATNIGAIGFLASIGYIDPVTGVAQGPTQQVDVYPIVGTALGQDQTTAVSEIEDTSRPGKGLVNATPNQDTGVRICVDSGGTDQHAVYTIGGQGRQLNVSFKTLNGDCAHDTTS